MHWISTVARIAALSIVAVSAQAQDAYMERKDMKGGKKEFSPYANRGFPTNVYFGDTHLHTALSIDAGAFGNRLGLDEAYRFTKGEEVVSATGYRARMAVRFFGGYEFTQEDVHTRLPARAGYTKGVPMGGDLGAAPAGKSPTFLVAALKDAMSGNLDRLQIIKGWVEGGKARERIYDVAVSDGRTIGADGRCRTPVGNTVDVARATWTNTIGDSELIAVWTDPDFDPSQRAFYYVRVLEIPTPRWTAYEAVRFGITMPPEAEMTTQERAYTSPIWYAP